MVAHLFSPISRRADADSAPTANKREPDPRGYGRFQALKGQAELLLRFSLLDHE